MIHELSGAAAELSRARAWPDTCSEESSGNVRPSREYAIHPRATKLAIAKRLASEQALTCDVVGDSADDDAAWPINVDKLTAAQGNVERLRGLAFHSPCELLRCVRPEWFGSHCVQDSAYANTCHDEQHHYHKRQPHMAEKSEKLGECIAHVFHAYSIEQALGACNESKTI